MGGIKGFFILGVLLLFSSRADGFCTLSDDSLSGVHIKPLVTGIRTVNLEVFIKIDPPIGVNPLNVNFSARALKGKVQTFLWDFGDGALCKGQRCTHTYEDPGVYIVKLTAVNAPDNPVKKEMAIFIQEKGKEKH